MASIYANNAISPQQLAAYFKQLGVGSQENVTFKRLAELAGNEANIHKKHSEAVTASDEDLDNPVPLPKATKQTLDTLDIGAEWRNDVVTDHRIDNNERVQIQQAQSFMREREVLKKLDRYHTID